MNNYKCHFSRIFIYYIDNIHIKLSQILCLVIVKTLFWHTIIYKRRKDVEMKSKPLYKLWWRMIFFLWVHKNLLIYLHQKKMVHNLKQLCLKMYTLNIMLFSFDVFLKSYITTIYFNFLTTRASLIKDVPIWDLSWNIRTKLFKFFQLW